MTSFFFDVMGLELSPDIMERARTYQDLCTSANYFWPNRHFVMVCDRPAAIRRDEEGRLSNDQKMAIQYKDEWGLYALDGIVLGKEIWQRIVSKEMSFKDIMAIENVDIRAVALKYNPEAMLSSGAELVDEGKERVYKSEPIYEHSPACYGLSFSSWDEMTGEQEDEFESDTPPLKAGCCKPVRYTKEFRSRNELYLIEKTELNRFLEEPEIWMLKMTCPTGRVFIEGVEPATARRKASADYCQAVALGLTETQYNLLRNEG